MKDELEPFAGPLLLVATAKEDIAKLKLACEAFSDTCKRVPFEQFDHKAGENVLKIRFEGGIPFRLRVDFARLVNDLRHALDQAVCDGALCLGATSIKNTYFPFGLNKLDFDSKVKQHCKFVREDLRAFIQQFNAYLGGDSLLWSLARLAAKKHQRVLAIYPDAGTAIMHGAGLDAGGPLKINMNVWNDARNELEFARAGPGGYIKYMQVDIPVQVIVGKADVVQGKPIGSLLDDYASKVEGIILGIKAETERLGGVR